MPKKSGYGKGKIKGPDLKKNAQNSAKKVSMKGGSKGSIKGPDLTKNAQNQ